MARADESGQGRVRRLSEDLANKIAAGEVVDRPASVVKELVENAIDSGASRIEVALEGGGRDLIEVVDDGEGMSHEDALRALERHATSKLCKVEDLFSIETLGFRGEALPSIAAVCRLEILTRPPKDVSGTSIRVEGGRLMEHVEAGAPAGTRVRASDLFYNLPARRKFLRRPETEVGHCSETFVRIALAHPEIGFRMTHGSRVLFNSPGSAFLSERVTAAVGRDVARQLYPVASAAGPVQVTGLLAAPDVTRASNRGIYFFVNRRFVRDRALNHAVSKAYGDLVERGRSPVVVLFISAPKGTVDVNVHPQKIEVRFSDARQVYEAVRHALSRSLHSSPWAGEANKQYRLDSSGDAKGLGVASPPRNQAGLLGLNDPRQAEAGFADHRARVLEALGRYGVSRGQRHCEKKGKSRDTAAGRLESLVENKEEGGGLANLRVIGQLQAAYILCESDAGLVVVDQHAAHERIQFEHLRAARSRRDVLVQGLLVPRTITLPAGQVEMLEEHVEVLSSVGFDVSSMGEGAVAVRGVPACIQEQDIARVLSDLIEELSGLGEQASFDLAVDRSLATVACHSVVRGGRVLSVLECEALLKQLDAVGLKGSCPHGRPVAFTLAVEEVERRLGRR